MRDLGGAGAPPFSFLPVFDVLLEWGGFCCAGPGLDDTSRSPLAIIQPLGFEKDFSHWAPPTIIITV